MSWINEVSLQTKKVFSQKNQDGVIEYIFKHIGTTNKFCVEFGFNSDSLTGGSGPNIANLVVNNGWSRLLLDSEHENKSINLHRALLSYDNISDVFDKHSVPKEPDYVSIDVDSVDLWLMKGMLDGGYRPRLISVEYNTNYPFGFSYTVTRKETPVPFDYKAQMLYGASLTALNSVAEDFDYSLIGIVNTLDLFFVRNDCLDVEAPPVTDFEQFTGHPLHMPTTKERLLDYVVEYPSEKPITLKTIESNADVFRTNSKIR